MGYSPRAYTWPTLVATPFPRILKTGCDMPSENTGTSDITATSYVPHCQIAPSGLWLHEQIEMVVVASLVAVGSYTWYGRAPYSNNNRSPLLLVLLNDTTTTSPMELPKSLPRSLPPVVLPWTARVEHS